MDIHSLRRDAESGNTAARTILGISYLYGDEGIAIDYGEAFRLLSMAAQKGASRAVANLAHMYFQGLGIPQDMTKAIELYETVGAVEFYAAISLGRIYASREGVAADAERASKWYSVAASFEGRVFECEELTEAKAFLAGRHSL